MTTCRKLKSVWHRQRWWKAAVRKTEPAHKLSLMASERDPNEAARKMAQAEANCARIKLWADEAVKGH